MLICSQANEILAGVSDKHMRGEHAMTIWRKDEETGLECGINDDGNLFLGNDCSGYNLPDTPENREYILNDFDRWN